MGEKIKGKLEVLIDADEHQAHIRFDPNGPEQRWDSDKIDELLDRNDVVAGIRDEVIDRLLIELPRQKEGKVYENVAVFEPPEEPSPETVTLTVDEIPEDLIPYRDKALIRAGAPQITETRTEKVQNLSGEGDKKGLFGKLSRDKEPVDLRETIKTVRIAVDPSVLEVRFCQKGVKIGDYRPPFSGKAGRTVKGNPVPPEKIAFKKFYIGRGIERRGGAFFAVETGFLRVGENWMDIAPFSAHEWSLSGDPSAGSFLLDFRPGMATLPPPAKEDLARFLDSSGISEDRRVPLDEIYRAILSALEKGAPLIGYPLCTGRDSEIRVDINPSQTRAELYLSKPGGDGAPLSLKAIGEALSAARIPKLDIERIKGEIQAFVKSRKTETVILLAEGKLPRRGKDKTLNYQVTFLAENELIRITERILQSPEFFQQLRSASIFPPEKINRMAFVRKGDPLFSISSAGEGEPGLDVFGHRIPGIGGNEPNITFYEGVIFKDGVAYAEQDGIFDLGETEPEGFLVRVRQHRDAGILVSVSENRMNAFVSVVRAEGTGCTVSRETVMEALEAAGVISGIREDLVLDLVDKAEAGDMIADFLVAEGRLPAGNEAVLKFLVPIEMGKQSSINIRKDDVFAEIYNYENDTSLGYDVLGEKLDLEMGSGLQIEIGENIHKDPQGEKTVLSAEKNGRLLYDGKSLSIKDRLSVQGDVSLKTGGIKFPGSVDIEGSVLSRVTVSAGENIRISEVVQDAFVSSDGNLQIGKGIKGGRKAVVRASGTLSFGFAEEANLLSVGDIQVGRAIMLCQVKCNGKIRGQGDSRLIGGVIKAKDGLEIGVIGSERGAKTVISFGQDYLVENQISVVNAELEKLRAFTDKLDEIMERLEKSPDKSKLLEIRKKKLQTLKMIEKKNLRLFLLKEKFEAHFPSEVRILDRIYPGVVIESHGRILEINEERKGFTVLFDPSNGKLMEKPL